jgi:hypothetical protein
VTFPLTARFTLMIGLLANFGSRADALIMSRLLIFKSVYCS